VYAGSGAQRDVLLPSGGLGQGRVPWDALSSLPPLPSCEAPFLARSGAKESAPAVAPLTGRPATTSAYAAPTSGLLSCRLLRAFVRSWRQWIYPPGLGRECTLPVRAEARIRLRTWVWAPGGWFHRTARVGRVQLDGFALACGGSGCLVGDRGLLPGSAGLAPTRLPSGSFARPFSLVRCLGFPSLLGHNVPLQLLQNSWAWWALRKISPSVTIAGETNTQ
jgi:hypothetical protein